METRTCACTPLSLSLPRKGGEDVSNGDCAYVSRTDFPRGSPFTLAGEGFCALASGARLGAKGGGCGSGVSPSDRYFGVISHTIEALAETGRSPGITGAGAAFMSMRANTGTPPPPFSLALIDRDAHEAHARRFRHQLGLGARVGDRCLDRALGRRLAVGDVEGDAIHLVGAGLDHRVEDAARALHVADGHAHLVRHLVADDRRRLVARLVGLPVNRVDVEARGAHVLLGERRPP